MHLQTATVERVVQETHDTRTLRLKLEKPTEFKCGQFFMVKPIINGKTENRAFSISSSPAQKDFIDITVKVYPLGRVSPHLYNLTEGAKLRIKGPYGEFIFDETANEAVLIGGGSGIAPLMAMIRYCDDKKLNTKLLLIYGVRTPRDIIFENELKEFAKRMKCVFTVEQPDSSWHGDIGRMNTELIKNHVKDFSLPLFYICGPPAMADLVENGLQEMGVSKEKIKTDKWL